MPNYRETEKWSIILIEFVSMWMWLVMGERKKVRVKERKRKSAGPLNPISPDEGYANDPEELNPTSHSKFGKGLFN